MRLLLLASAALVAGCAAPMWTGTAKQLSEAGNCQAARNVVAENSQGGDLFAYLGAVYADCDHNTKAAYYHFTMAARYGHSGAQKILAEAGQPVPTPDLGAPEPRIGGAEAALILLDGYTQGRAAGYGSGYEPPAMRAPAAAPSYRCTSRSSGMFGNQIRTDCLPQ